MKSTTINILGTDYTVTIKRKYQDKHFQSVNGNGLGRSAYTNNINHEIGLRYRNDIADKTERLKTMIKTAKHEIIHAYLNESGLQFNSHHYNGPWACNEEMIDWFAIQGMKIYFSWNEIIKFIEKSLDEIYEENEKENECDE